MMSDSRVIILVLLRNNAGDARSLGNHEFIAVPRIGEEVVIEDDGQEFVLRVHSVSHVGDSTESSPSQLPRLPAASVRIMCDEA